MKKAFTMLELLFVIIVISILAAAIIPSMKSDKLREAAIQVLSHIRYTQHLAMVDDKYGDNTLGTTNWYKKRWQLLFGTSVDTNGKIAYTIFSDTATSTTNSKPSVSEMASDTMNPDKVLSGGYSSYLETDDPRANKKMNLGESYGIDDVTFNDGCSGALHISFDHLGRPLRGETATLTGVYNSSAGTRLIVQPCNIILISSTEGNLTIRIEPETGYAHIL